MTVGDMLADRIRVEVAEYSTRQTIDMTALSFESGEAFTFGGTGSLWLELTVWQDLTIKIGIEGMTGAQTVFIGRFTDTNPVPSHATMAFVDYGQDIAAFDLVAGQRYLFSIQDLQAIGGAPVVGTWPLVIRPFNVWSSWVTPDPMQISIVEPDQYAIASYGFAEIFGGDSETARAAAYAAAAPGPGFAPAVSASPVVSTHSALSARPTGDPVSPGSDPFYKMRSDYNTAHWPLDSTLVTDPARWPAVPTELSALVHGLDYGVAGPGGAVVRWAATPTAVVVVGDGLLESAPAGLVQEGGHANPATVDVTYRVNSYPGAVAWHAPQSSGIWDYHAINGQPGDTQTVTGSRAGSYDVAGMLDGAGKAVVWCGPDSAILPDERTWLQFFGSPKVTLPVQLPPFRYRTLAPFAPPEGTGSGWTLGAPAWGSGGPGPAWDGLLHARTITGDMPSTFTFTTGVSTVGGVGALASSDDDTSYVRWDTGSNGGPRVLFDTIPVDAVLGKDPVYSFYDFAVHVRWRYESGSDSAPANANIFGPAETFYEDAWTLGSYSDTDWHEDVSNFGFDSILSEAVFRDGAVLYLQAPDYVRVTHVWVELYPA